MENNVYICDNETNKHREIMNLSFEVIVGYDKWSQPIAMEIQDVMRKHPHLKSLQDLNDLLQSDNDLF